MALSTLVPNRVRTVTPGATKGGASAQRWSVLRTGSGPPKGKATFERPPAVRHDCHTPRWPATHSPQGFHAWWCARHAHAVLREEGVRDLRAVNEAHLAAYARRLERHRTRRGEPLAAASRAATLSVVRRFFAFLHARGLILGNPALSLKLPKAKHLPRGVLSEAQARRLMAAPFPWTLIGRRDRAALAALRLGPAHRRSSPGGPTGPRSA